MAEKPTMRLIISILAGITNMVLDLLLIAVFDMGVVGAALATCISQVVGGIVPLIYFIIKNKSPLTLMCEILQSSISGRWIALDDSQQE